MKYIDDFTEKMKEQIDAHADKGDETWKQDSPFDLLHIATRHANNIGMQLGRRNPPTDWCEVRKQSVHLANMAMMIYYRVTDTWVESKDEFGSSYKCSLCGKHVFYVKGKPEPCDHILDEVESEVTND